MNPFDEITTKQPEAESVEPPASTDASDAAQPPDVPTNVQQPPAEPSGEEAHAAEPQEEKDEAWEAESKARQSQHGDNWAIRTARELFKEKSKHKPLLELGEQHGLQAVRAGTQIASVCLDPTAEPTAMVEAVRSSLPQSQFNKLRDEITWSTAFKYPDVFMQGFFGEGATVKEIEAALADYRQFGPSASGAQQDEDELGQLPDAVKKKLEDYDRVMSQFPQLQKTVEGYQQQTVKAEISQKADELYDSVWSVVGEKTQNLPLKVEDTDSDRVKGIKESLNQLLSQENVENAFLADPTNKKNYLAAIEYVKLRDYKTAFSYEEALKVGLENAVLSLLDGPRVKSLLSALKSESLAETTPPNPTARKELVAGAPASFNPTDMFDEAAKEGVTNPFDAVELHMQRTKGQRAGHSA